MTKTMQEKAINAAELLLHRRGYEIIDTNDKFVIAESEDGELVFAHVSITDSEDFADTPTRELFERFAFTWLMKHSETNMHIRFDDIAMIVMGDERAFVRHNINCVSDGSCMS